MNTEQTSHLSLSPHHLQYNLGKILFLKGQFKLLEFLGILASAGASNAEAFNPLAHNSSLNLFQK